MLTIVKITFCRIFSRRLEIILINKSYGEDENKRRAPEPIFDALLRPAIENPQVDSIQFVLDTAQRPLWEQTIQARIMACPGHDKVRPPRWRSLPRNVSFIMADGE
ncbi:MAG TPA: hypothetical protein PKA80_11970, partial [Ignavibacteriaceae bacterium]|nr:hypothetical protein [Ignavibacteriaceae bacterium]